MKNKPIILLVALLMLVFPAWATDRTWTGATDRDWFTDNNWNPSGVPQGGDNVSITNSTGNLILLTNSTAWLNSFVITNSTLFVTNWETKIQATNVIVRKNGKLQPVSGFLESDPSNRVYVVCSNLFVEANGSIFADALGYRASGMTVSGPGKGGSSGDRGAGGSYGGIGGRSGDARPVYGETNAPTGPGSTGGYGYNGGPGAGDGGGAIRIEADLVVVNGTLTANGGNSGTYGGGGSGGGIYITCNTFAGTGGIVHAKGGTAALGDTGNGGGGRIALVSSNYVHPVGVVFSVLPGASVALKGQIGTLYLSNRYLLTETLNQFDGVRLIIPGLTLWSVTNLTVTAGPLAFEFSDFVLNVESNLVILSNAWFCVGGVPLMTASGTANAVSGNLTNPLVAIGGNLTLDRGILTLGGSGQKTFTSLSAGGELLLTNGASLRVYSGETNATTLSYGALLAVTGGTTRILPQSWIYCYANPTNGGAPKLHFGNVVVATNAGFNADGTGYQVGSGTGKGGGSGGSNTGSGGGHGGAGGASSSAAGGIAYGSSNAPIRPGSGGGSYDGTAGHGGGAVWLKTRDLTLNGIITANGLYGGTYNAGGSGGGIFIDCQTLTGDTTAVVRANGGDRNVSYAITGGGGGGRISVAIGFLESDMTTLLAGGTPANMVVVPAPATFLGQFAANPAALSYAPAATGTVQIIKISTDRIVTVAGSPGNYGNPVPGYQNWIDITNGTMFTNTVSTPADQLNGLRRACVGWRLTLTAGGGLVDSGTGTQAIFQVTNNMTITWLWTNEYQLAVSSSAGGSATTSSNGWYTNGFVVAGLTAVPEPNYAFSQWSGDVPDGDVGNNPLAVIMTQPRTFIATYYSTVVGTNRVWTGNGDWRYPGTNWNPVGRPGPLDSVVLASGNCRISTNEQISSLLISNGATLTFTNWTTSVQATENVVIRSNATVTVAANYTTTQMSNRVWIICGNLTMDAGGLINVDGLGYFTHTGPGKGTGGDSNTGSGGGHGGRGGDSSTQTGGGIYGLTNAPLTPGSGGGGSYDNAGGHGGGVVWIDARGAVQINGTISANGGGGATYNGGGAAGSIFIISTYFAGGLNGILRANGGGRGGGYVILGGGGGGRIAVWHGAIPAANRETLLAGGLPTNPMLIFTNSCATYLGTLTVDPASASYALGGTGSVSFITVQPPLAIRIELQ